MIKSQLELRFGILLHEMKVNKRFEREFFFHPTRKWRVDFCDTKNKVAVEIEGGLFSRKRGGHNRGKAIIDDMEKYNALTMMGYRLLRYSGFSDMQRFKDDYPAMLTQIQKEKENV